MNKPHTNRYSRFLTSFSPNRSTPGRRLRPTMTWLFRYGNAFRCGSWHSSKFVYTHYTRPGFRLSLSRRNSRSSINRPRTSRFGTKTLHYS